MKDLEAEIAWEHYFTAAEGVRGEDWDKYLNSPACLDDQSPLNLLTFCVLVLHNGFTVTGESACASPENFNVQMGRDIARRKAVEKLWPLLGFRLRDARSTQQGVVMDAPRPNTSTPATSVYEATLSARVNLPCGHVISNQVKVKETAINSEKHLNRIALSMKQKLDFWVKNRTQRHDCSLVSETNPNGKRPLA
jgi:hypothetical protein